MKENLENQTVSGTAFFVKKFNKTQLLKPNVSIIISSTSFLKGHISTYLVNESAQFFELCKSYEIKLMIPFPEHSWNATPMKGSVFLIGVNEIVGYFIFNEILPFH